MNTSTIIEPAVVAISDAVVLGLARDVGSKVFDATEVFRDDNVGADLAYLLIAIHDNKPDSFVDWSEESRKSALHVILEKEFAADHPVWRYIRRAQAA